MYDIIIFILVGYILYKLSEFYNRYNNKDTWYNNNDLEHNVVMREEIENRGYIQTDSKQAKIFIPQDSKELNDTVYYDYQIILMVNDHNQFIHKDKLWKSLVNFYGREYARRLMPTIYLVPKDYNLFKDECNPNKHYILKKQNKLQDDTPIEKGDCLKITNIINNINEKMRGYPSEMITMVQEFENNTFTINKHRLTLRVYMLIICQQNRKYFYIYDDGYISYSKQAYDGQNNYNTSIASLEHSEPFYKEYPMLLSDLDDYLDRQDLINKIIDLMNNVIPTLDIHVKSKWKYKNNLMAEIFSIDLILVKMKNKKNEQIIIPKLLKINNAPEMKPINQRDYIIKQELHSNVFDTLLPE